MKKTSVTSVGFGIMVGSVAGLVAAYPSGWLADRFGRKAVIVPSTIATGVSFLMFCVASTDLLFLAACILWGIASMVASTTPGVYAADSAPPGMNAPAISIFRAVSDAGYVIGPLMVGVIVDLAGPVSAITAMAILLIAIGLAFAILAPETHRGSRARAEGSARA